MKKSTKIIFLLLGFGLMCLLFYVIFSPKYRDVSNEKPFSEIVNKKLVTKVDIQILANPDLPIDEQYIYHLEDGTSYGMNSELEILAEIPVGTEFTIDKVEMHTGTVSGSTTAYLFGQIFSEESEVNYKFVYNWGNHHFLYEDKPYWTFEQAFWQSEPLNRKYFIATP